MLSLFMYLMSLVMFILSVLFITNSTITFIYFPIYPMNSTSLSISLIMDWPSLMFSSTVCFISATIIIYSMSYIPKKEHTRFSLVLMIFVMSMLILIFSNNIFFIILGWDGLGLSSYILVIYYQNHKSSESGAITILSNRIGDISLIMAISVMFSLNSWEFYVTSKFPIITLILIFIAAITKSAQLPFSAWLPAAMAAPTPISALVHSSTLVTAGIFILIRVMTTNHPLIMLLMLILASSTLLFSGLSANWEQDMKKIIALSTLSQIAFMMFAISIFSPMAALFHLITHAIFKSTMFMSAGIMIHGTSYQDLRSYGSPKTFSPLLMLSFGITSMALMGLPFMSGFFSKDLIIETFTSSSLNMYMMILIMTAMGLTASYSLRMNLMMATPFMKMQKDKSFHMDNKMTLCILISTPISVILGSTLAWLTINPSIFVMPLLMKTSIFLFIMIGSLTGALLNFKSNMYQFLGQPSISLWFMNTLSSYFPLKFLPTSNNLSKLDKSWLETLSAYGCYYILSYYASKPLKMKLLTTIPIMMLVSYPMISLLS